MKKANNLDILTPNMMIEIDQMKSCQKSQYIIMVNELNVFANTHLFICLFILLLQLTFYM